MDKTKKDQHSAEKSAEKIKLTQQHIVRVLAVVVLAAIAFVVLLYGYAFTSSPATVRKPQFEHFHFRTQIIVEGRSVNFAGDTFQEGYAKDNCNVDIATSPFHFHDKKDQMTHVHWKDMTGGQFLKYYGWNLTGGPGSMLGYRFDSLPRVNRVPIHGKNLPDIPKGATFYIYSGDQQSHQQRSWDHFLKQDLESFFGKESSVGEPSVSLWDRLFPKAIAHAGHDHEPVPTNEAEAQEANLQRINNLIGNVVIFVQKDKPTSAQVDDRFNDLEPLTASTCSG
ncbi:MAG TPA: hypothetical protein VF733_01965 [Candidatus Saccharimonadales bacterium]